MNTEGMFTPLLLTGLLTAGLPSFNRTISLPAGQAYSPVHVDRQRAVLEGRGQLLLIPRQGEIRWVPSRVTVEEVNSSQFRGTQVLPSGEMQSLRLDFRACEAQIWSGNVGRRITNLKGDFKDVLMCGRETAYFFFPDFSPDGNRLVTADHNGLRLWETSSGKLLKAQPGSFLNVMYRPNGTHVVAVANTSKGLQLELWRSDLTRRISALQLPQTCLSGMASGIDVDNEQVAFGCQGEVQVWNWREGRVAQLKRSNPVNVLDAAPVLYLHYVAVNEHDRGAALWDIRSGQRLLQAQVPEGVQVTDIAFAPGGLLAVALSNGTVQTYDAEKQGKYLETQQVFNHASQNQYLTLTFSGNWAQMLVVSNREARVIELPRG